MRHHRTVGPPSKPGHGRGLRPIRTIGFDKPPVGRSKLDCWKTTRQLQIALSETWRDALGSWLSETWRDALGSWLSGTSLFNIAGAALVTSLPARALTWTLSRHRLNQPSIRRLEGTTSKNNELNAYGQKESFLWRHAAAATSLVCSTREHPGDARTQPTWFRAQRPEQRIWRKQTTSNLLLVNKQVHSN